MAKLSMQAKMDRMEKENEALKQRIDTMLQLMAAQGAQSRTVAVGAQFQQVGIRNISSYTVGVPSPVKGEPDVQLTAHDWKNPHPASTAAVSYPFWQMLRKSQLVARGMIVRDDSILGDTSLRAPEDQPDDLAPGADLNQVADPDAWIEARTEDEIRDAITAMTSEPSVRRLLAAVDQKIFDIGEARYKDSPERGKRAIRDLSAKYRLVEDLGKERLDELLPSSRGRADETKTVATF